MDHHHAVNTETARQPVSRRIPDGLTDRWAIHRKTTMTTYAAEVEARRAQLLALANAATGEGLRLLDIADALRRHAGRLEAFPTSPATGQPTVPNLSNQHQTKSATP